jgi:glutamine amidotransferase
VCTALSNYQSIIRAFTWLEIDTVKIQRPTDFKNVSHIILPGVSAFGSLMKELQQRDFLEQLELSRSEGKQILGLCAGMQVLGERSQESEMKGLGWLDFECFKIDSREMKGIRSFHTGWNDVAITSKLLNVNETNCFYFNHSYYAANAPEDISIGKTSYGITFTSMVEKDNLIGAQFHPEKSQAAGLNFLKKFSGLKA